MLKILDFINESSVWDILQHTTKPIILYGTGNGADKVIDEFERLGIELSGVFVSDDFARGQTFRGFAVQKLSFFEERYQDFIVAVAFASSINSVMQNVKNIAEKYETYVPCVPVYGDEIPNRAFFDKYENEILACYDILSDEQSRKVYIGALKFEYTGKLEYLFDITTDKQEVFENILKLSDDEHYYDLGAYRGDTIDEFLYYTSGKYQSITAFEPDTKTFKKLCNHCEGMKNTRFINVALDEKAGEKVMSMLKGRGSALTNTSKGYTIKCVAVDDILIDNNCTYLKADIEGNELSMLKGAINTLKLCSPKLNIAGYHHFRDIFELPLLIKSINSDYNIYIRKHPYIPCWDLNIYCTITKQ